MSDNKFIKVKDAGIILEKGKKYILCISPDIPNILPIIKLFENYNPIFISAGEHLDIQENDFICLRKEPFFSVKELVEELSHSKTVLNLIEALRIHQENIWVKTWCNHKLFQPFFDKPGIKSLGFSPDEAQWMNNKIFQYELLKDVVPIADFILADKKCCLDQFEKFKTEKGVLTILAFGGAGSGVKIHATRKDLEEYFEKIDDEKLILARIIEKKASPSIDILVANEKEIIVFGLADQILNGLQCLGATYPTILDDKTKNQCYELAKTVGSEIAKKGLRGYFSIDIIVDENNNPFFSEINGRYAGTTANRLLAMEQSRPQNHPSILDLE
ncbi:MAG: ATP-grasp domain-containing protein, partial [Candidatus Aenigmarchaeota archaeon]|nr:ATP-grasp domain-containing protein [Candidatus Aenigmarchaeota archaeon]